VPSRTASSCPREVLRRGIFSFFFHPTWSRGHSVLSFFPLPFRGECLISTFPYGSVPLSPQKYRGMVASIRIPPFSPRPCDKIGLTAPFPPPSLPPFLTPMDIGPSNAVTLASVFAVKNCYCVFFLFLSLRDGVRRIPLHFFLSPRRHSRTMRYWFFPSRRRASRCYHFFLCFPPLMTS